MSTETILTSKYHLRNLPTAVANDLIVHYTIPCRGPRGIRSISISCFSHRRGLWATAWNKKFPVQRARMLPAYELLPLGVFFSICGDLLTNHEIPTTHLIDHMLAALDQAITGMEVTA